MAAEGANAISAGLSDIQKYGLGAVGTVFLAAVVWKFLDLFKILIKKIKPEEADSKAERRVGSADLMAAIKAVEVAANLAKDSGYDATQAAAEANASAERVEEIVKRTHERANRIMEIQHELVASMNNVSQNIAQLSLVMQSAVVLLNQVSKDMAVSMATITASLNKDSKSA